MLRFSPATTKIGTSGKYLSTTEQSSVAANSSSPSAQSYAFLMTDARNACGVWPRRKLARGGMARRVFSEGTSMMVSADGMATSPASYVSRARKQSCTIRGATSGRTASWNKTLQSSSPRWSSARRVVPLRVGAPSRIPETLLYPPDRTISRTASRWPGAIMMSTSSTSACWSSTASVCSRMGRPAILINCFGRSRPTREPKPPASRTATFLNETSLPSDRVDKGGGFDELAQCVGGFGVDRSPVVLAQLVEVRSSGDRTGVAEESEQLILRLHQEPWLHGQRIDTEL